MRKTNPIRDEVGNFPVTSGWAKDFLTLLIDRRTVGESGSQRHPQPEHAIGQASNAIQQEPEREIVHASDNDFEDEEEEEATAAKSVDGSAQPKEVSTFVY